MDQIQTKKSLGQNWLKSKLALSKMLEAGDIGPQDIILEVGPGKGVLTEKLLAKAKKVIAVEKDDRLIPFLQEKFNTEIQNDKLEIIHEDILDFNPNSLSCLRQISQRDDKLQATSYKLVANIPYYITGQFLRKFLETDNQPERIVVMVQKEIAQRIIAHEGKESLLSISVKAFGTPKMVMKVGKENFSPSPKVDSAILLISDISKNLFRHPVSNLIEDTGCLDEERFFKILHAGFAHKRKMLIGNLKSAFGEANLKEIFKLSKIDEKIRAEDLTLENWVRLIKSTSPKE